ncbi:hypothetical protein TNCV_813971 [Trichonephila clavipes]|nr:hypothetical protein TNCV_813971 [Trichonephila clavipes]
MSYDYVACKRSHEYQFGCGTFGKIKVTAIFSTRRELIKPNQKKRWDHLDWVVRAVEPHRRTLAQPRHWSRHGSTSL